MRKEYILRIDEDLFEEVKKLADKNEKVIFGGRLGQYKYFDMDKVIIESLKLVKNELI